MFSCNPNPSKVFALPRPLEDIVTFLPEPVLKREFEKLKLSSDAFSSSAKKITLTQTQTKTLQNSSRMTL